MTREADRTAAAGLAGLERNTRTAAAFALGASQTRSAGGGRTSREEKRRDGWRFFRAARELAAELGLGRLATCCRLPGSATAPRDWGSGALCDPVVLVDGNGTARYRGLARCGSVWGCPGCADCITGRRAAEVQRVIWQWRDMGGVALLLTYTARHERGDNLRGMVGQFRAGLRRLKSARGYRRLLEGVGYHGSVRAIEVTYSDAHGWHPHIHEIWLVKPPGGLLDGAALAAFEDAVYALWAAAAAKVAFSTDRQAFRARSGYRVVGDYLARGAVWGMGAEVARLPRKRGRASQTGPAAPYVGAVPMEILARAIAGEPRARALWVEYVRAMHGQRQLYWSPGLRASFTPEVALLDPPATAGEQHVLDVPAAAWRALTRLGWESRLLDQVEAGARDGGIEHARHNARWVLSQALARCPPPPPDPDVWAGAVRAFPVPAS